MFDCWINTKRNRLKYISGNLSKRDEINYVITHDQL